MEVETIAHEMKHAYDFDVMTDETKAYLGALANENRDEAKRIAEEDLEPPARDYGESVRRDVKPVLEKVKVLPPSEVKP